MSSLKPNFCPITGDTDSRLIFSYSNPPCVEIGYIRSQDEPYHREVWQFLPSGHFISTHEMKVLTSYDGHYLEATYGNNASMIATFERIINLPPERSDNAGRFLAVERFASRWLDMGIIPSVLDIGAGLGVFPHAVHKAGWSCTAIDPDWRCVDHYKDTIGVTGICGDFMSIEATSQFDIVTLNKVLEHVIDPIAMLQRVHHWLKPSGFVYLEVPDGEVASKYGCDREEFTIEHLHIFSVASTAILASKAGFEIQTLTRLQEPSTKYTIRAFLSQTI